MRVATWSGRLNCIAGGKAAPIYWRKSREIAILAYEGAIQGKGAMAIYDFNNQIHTYNLNKSTDKTQLIYNTTDNCIFSSQITNQHLSLRMFPIYNTRDKELYYSTPINFKLD